jgi:topoisomerase IA-like protein
VQKDGNIGFEFEAKDPTKARGRGARPTAALRVLGAHPKTRAPVELHSGRYGPYVKHGAVNATIPDRDQVDTLTLDDALALLAAKTGKPAPARAAAKTAARAPAKTAAKVPAKKPATTKAAAKSAAKTPVARKAAPKAPAAAKSSARKPKAS